MCVVRCDVGSKLRNQPSKTSIFIEQAIIGLEDDREKNTVR